MNTFTSESVCAGHPDKICDQVSDMIVDEALSKDVNSRVAVETMVSENFLAMVGEVSCSAKIPYEKIARSVVGKLGYTNRKYRFSNLSPMTIKIHSQSSEIAVGVDNLGAGDQGMMFGYASDETKNLMPIPISIAHNLAQAIDTARETRKLAYLRPDGKTQVSVKYENGRPKSIESIVLAVPHKEKVTLDVVKKDLYTYIVKPVLAQYGFSISVKDIVVNGTGVWHRGGPASDSGVTGRKIVVDTYGGMARVGGGAFSGKDPTKVDRSGAYAARYLAKNIVAAKLAKRCEVRLAYFIGAKKPVMQDVETFGTEKKSKKIITDFMTSLLDTSVAGILKTLDLRRPIYFKSASYGHFGRPDFPWEKIVS